MRRVAIVACCTLAWLGSAPARADFEISLREGSTMIVQSYQIEGNKLIAYQPSGTVEVMFSRVVNVRDLRFGGTIASPRPRPQAEPAPSAASSGLSSLPRQDDGTARERELTRAIIVAYRDLGSAQYRGDSKEEIDRRKAEIARLEKERAGLHEPSTHR